MPILRLDNFRKNIERTCRYVGDKSANSVKPPHGQNI